MTLSPIFYWAPDHGTCPECGLTYERGDWVTVMFDAEHRARWVHEHCWKDTT